MATILQFRRNEETPPKRPPNPDKGMVGEIIVFPGVRIERWGLNSNPRGSTLAARKGIQRRKK